MAGRNLEPAVKATEAARLVAELHRIVTELETLHCGRKFTLDGHLVGSIGETMAEAMFELTLMPQSTPGHDALAFDDRKVEIKATYGSTGVGVRETSRSAATSLIVLRLSRGAGSDAEVVYNGPLAPVHALANRAGSNGQALVSLAKLRKANVDVAEGERIARRRDMAVG